MRVMKSTWKSCSKYVSHCNSHTVEAKTRYSASKGDLETMIFFFDFQYMSESPKKLQNPVIDLLVSLHEAQSESLKAFS